MPASILQSTLQAGALSALSNVLAQLIQSWRLNTPYTLRPVDIFHFVLFSVLACPPNVIWQSWLEAQFPARTKELPPIEKEALVDQTVRGSNAEDEKAKKQARSKPGSLNVKNTAVKFALDQTLGAGMNTILFIIGIALIRGQSWASIQNGFSDKFWKMIFDGQKFWPAVSIANFALVPLEYRMLVGNIAGLFWNIYLSLQATST